MAMGLRKSLSAAVLGAAMLAGGVSGASAEQTPVIYAGPEQSNSAVSALFTLVSGQSYDFSAWLTNEGEAYSGFTVGTATLVYVSTKTAVAVVSTLLNTGNFGTSASTLFTASNTGSYKIKFLLDNSEATDRVSGFGAIALHKAPGPVAGAGLPVLLGLMGFAAWRRRQSMAA
jgi:hypothetical protein